MGREADCACETNGVSVSVKALLESRELILRGGVSRRIPFTDMDQVRASGDRLCFEFKAEAWSLAIGGRLAAQWAAVISAPPPSLAKKMGITAERTVELAGSVDDKNLENALAEAKSVTKRGGELIVARVDTYEALAHVLKAKAEPLASGIPMWVVYRKGRGQALSEHGVRELCLAAGLVDHKVTAVSPALTALRFIKRHAAARAGS
jgi:hypothetical protein